MWNFRERRGDNEERGCGMALKIILHPLRNRVMINQAWMTNASPTIIFPMFGNSMQTPVALS